MSGEHIDTFQTAVKGEVIFPEVLAEKVRRICGVLVNADKVRMDEVPVTDYAWEVLHHLGGLAAAQRCPACRQEGPTGQDPAMGEVEAGSAHTDESGPRGGQARCGLCLWWKGPVRHLTALAGGRPMGICGNYRNAVCECGENEVCGQFEARFGKAKRDSAGEEQ